MDTGKSEGLQAIAGCLTAEDWRKLRAELHASDRTSPWDRAYRDYYRQRLDLRYLEPIRTLQENGSYQGEGFSIVSIQCALIEFLAATHNGCAYRFLTRGEILGPHEYSSSRQLFVDFLQQVPPFSSVFTTPAIATEFYGSVRCGLLHEATTKNGWRIHASGPAAIDAAKKIVFRNQFQTLMLAYIEDFGARLLNDKDLQEAFLRKFDRLADDAA